MTHWMRATVVENGLGPAAALWAVRSGTPVDAEALGTATGSTTGDARAALATADALDAVGRTGDDRLAGMPARRTGRPRPAPVLRTAGDRVAYAVGLGATPPDAVGPAEIGRRVLRSIGGALVTRTAQQPLLY